MALGQFCAVGPVDQGDMGEVRNVPAHRLIDRDLAEGIAEMVIAADHMRHAHIMVIHHNGPHIGRRAVGAQQDHVVQFAGLDGHAALYAIFQHTVAAIRRAQADRMGRIL